MGPSLAGIEMRISADRQNEKRVFHYTTSFSDQKMPLFRAAFQIHDVLRVHVRGWQSLERDDLIRRVACQRGVQVRETIDLDTGDGAGRVHLAGLGPALAVGSHHLGSPRARLRSSAHISHIISSMPFC